VGELADRAGRDYTTVSRQVAKLAELGLIERRPSPTDRRVNEAVLSSAGRRMTDAIDAARHRLNTAVFSDWSNHDLLELERLARRYVDDRLRLTAAPKKPDTPPAALAPSMLEFMDEASVDIVRSYRDLDFPDGASMRYGGGCHD